MKISLDWIRDYAELPADLSVEQLMHDLTMSTVEVEGAELLADGLQNVVVGRVVSTEPHADGRLTLTQCDVGDGQPRRIICGARNVTDNMLVAIALPGASIRPYGKPERLQVKPTEVAGVVSEGVICAANELGLEELFSGYAEKEILDLSALDLQPGTELAPAIGWNDIVFEIDNKSLTNRPDLWGHYGMARELAAIYGCELKPLPEVQRDFPAGDYLGHVEPGLCHRFTATKINNIRVEPAPLWLQSRLARVGQRPLNLYVDLTNYISFTVGQPCHTFDAEKINLPLGARPAGDDQSATLLDDHEYSLQPDMLVIADSNGPVAVAGVMGGAGSSVSETTSEILLEIANFDALSVRRTSTRLGLRTEASSRFEKAIDTQRIDQGLDLFIHLMREIQPEATVEGFQDQQLKPTDTPTIDVDVDFLQQRLGTPLPAADMQASLESIGFGVNADGNRLSVTVPTWRATGDVSQTYDLVEEVARLHGYDNFDFVAPEITLNAKTVEPRVSLERRFKELFAAIGGMQEVVTYPWVKDRYLEAAGLDKTDTVKLAVAPAPDQDSMQPSLIPNLLECMITNLRYRSEFRIFESGRVFTTELRQTDTDARESLPTQPRYFGGALVGDDPQALFLQAKGIIESVIRAVHVETMSIAVLGDSDSTGCDWAEPQARLGIYAGDQHIGTMGVLCNRSRRLAGIKRGSAALFEFNIDALEPLASRENRYRPLPEYPEVDFDLAPLFPNRIEWADIAGCINGLHPLIRGVSYVDQYSGAGIPDGRKSITLRLRLGSDERTLVSEEVNDIAELVAETLERKLSAEIRS